MPASTDPRKRTITVYSRVGSGGYVTLGISPQAPNQAGVTRLDLDFTLPAESTELQVRWYHGHDSGDMWIDRLGLFDITTATPPPGWWVPGLT